MVHASNSLAQVVTGSAVGVIGSGVGVTGGSVGVPLSTHAENDEIAFEQTGNLHSTLQGQVICVATQRYTKQPLPQLSGSNGRAPQRAS